MASEEPQDVAARALTPEERRAGYRRLALAGAVLVSLALLVGLVLVALGADAASGIGAGFGMVGLVLVLGGVVAFTRTGSIRRSHGEVRMATDAERKDAERLALALLGTGIIFSVVSLAVA